MAAHVFTFVITAWNTLNQYLHTKQGKIGEFIIKEEGPGHYGALVDSTMKSGSYTFALSQIPNVELLSIFWEFQKPKKVGLSDCSNLVHVVDVGDVGVEFY